MEAGMWLRAVLAFCLVLGLIGLFALALRRFGGKLNMPRAGMRLGVVEACNVSPRHRLVLVRRDQVEHVLLVGPDTALLVESGIGKPDEHA